jgi:hypothetical protein
MTRTPADMPGTPAGGYTPAQRAQVRGAFDRAFAGVKMPPRHRADVTADQLADDVTKWAHLLDGAEADAAGAVIHALREIADGTRS